MNNDVLAKKKSCTCNHLYQLDPMSLANTPNKFVNNCKVCLLTESSHYSLFTYIPPHVAFPPFFTVENWFKDDMNG